MERGVESILVHFQGFGNLIKSLPADFEVCHDYNLKLCRVHCVLISKLGVTWEHFIIPAPRFVSACGYF
jgi:hypothetical protein